MDFFNPKIRRELEKKDEEIKKATGLKGAAPGGDEWVWLTSYSRIPVSLFFFVKFCIYYVQLQYTSNYNRYSLIKIYLTYYRKYMLIIIVNL